VNRPVLRDLSALVAGSLFGAGLFVSGMTRPEKVLGFLDIFGAWDASLMLVMLGAIGVHAIAYRSMRGRSAPLFSATFAVPRRRDLDVKLLIGAALFGAGWGLGGYCPGPAITSLPGGGLGAAVFVVAMLTGTFATGLVEKAKAGNHSGSSLAPTRHEETDMFNGQASSNQRVGAANSSSRIVLDVRTPEEYASGHVPEALNIPVQELAQRHVELGAKDTPIVIYCRSGARSASAAGLLRKLGYSNLTDVGAMSNWRA
jgi:rhodanese-related sulfurtransferase/uncharacterized membrane protein YedE/YeeE